MVSSDTTIILRSIIICWAICTAIVLSTTVVSAQSQKNEFLTKVVDKIQQLQKEVADLRNQNERMKNGMRVLRKETQASLKKLRVQIKEQKATASTATRVENTALYRDLQLLDDAVKALKLRLDEIEQTMTADNRAADTEQVPEPQRPIDETIVLDRSLDLPLEHERAPAPPLSTAKKVTDEDEYSAYSLAMAALDNADYTRLRDELSIFLQDYPQGNFAADASYWIADSYYAEGEWNKAETHFLQLTQNHRDSDKYEMALLKIAFIKQRNKQWQGARDILEPLASDAEDEKIRVLANERLEQMNKQNR